MLGFFLSFFLHNSIFFTISFLEMTESGLSFLFLWNTRGRRPHDEKQTRVLKLPPVENQRSQRPHVNSFRVGSIQVHVLYANFPIRGLGSLPESLQAEQLFSRRRRAWHLRLRLEAPAAERKRGLEVGGEEVAPSFRKHLRRALGRRLSTRRSPSVSSACERCSSFPTL